MNRLLVFFVPLLICSLSALAENDWSRSSVYRKANNELTASPVVVFMGNSITEQWYVKDSVFFTKNNFVCRGISGQVTSQMLVRFQADVINLNPKIVVLLAGINDIAHNSGYAISVNDIFQNIVSMVDIARFHKIKVVLCTLVAADEIGWKREINPKQPVAELNRLITDFASKNNIPLVDYYSVTANENGGLKDELRMPNKDAIHPGLPGYKVMEVEVMKTLKQMNICK